MHKSQKHPLAIRVSIRVISAIFLFVIIWQAYLLLFPHARVTFKTYKPNGYSINNAQEILYTPDIVIPGLHNIFKPEVMIYFTVKPANLSITERKMTNSKPTCGDIATNQTCTIEKTNNGLAYSLTTTTDAYATDSQGNTATSQGVGVIMGNASIDITSDDNLHWTKAQWGAFIDSFEQSRFPGLKSVWSKPGP